MIQLLTDSLVLEFLCIKLVCWRIHRRTEEKNKVRAERKTWIKGIWKEGSSHAMCIFLKAQSLHKHDKENAFNFPYHLAWCYMSNISSQILQTYFQYVVSEKQTTPPVYLLDRRLSSPALRRTFLQTLHGFQPAELKMHRFNISISMSWFICIGTNVFRILSLWVKQYNNPNMTQCKECDQWALGSIGFLKPINLPLSACPSGFWSLPHICPLFESTLGTKMHS